MKTTGKYIESFTPSPYLLVEKPEHSQLLKSPEKNSSLIQELIEIKKKRHKRTKAESFLFGAIGLCISMLMVYIAFEWKFYESQALVDLKHEESTFEEVMDIPTTIQPPPPPPVIEQPRIVEVSNEVEILEEIEVNLDVEVTEDLRITEVNTENLVIEAPVEEEVTDEIFTIVEHRPEPEGGMAAFYGFVSEHIEYPSVARRTGIKGKVFVEFVVERNGSLTDIKVVKGIGGGCDEEAVRVLGMVPPWNPGKQRGKPVRVRMIIPIHFTLME